MKTMVLGLLAETPVHPGAGQDIGFVDMPVAREAATDYPVIVGSSFKGALRDLAYQSAHAAAVLDQLEEIEAKNRAKERADTLFGRQDNAGPMLVSDVRLVLLPVRSLTSHYKWVTCPHLLERLCRDLRRAECEGGNPSFQSIQVEQGRYLGAGESSLFLEERQFTRGGELPNGIVEVLGKLIAHNDTRNRLADQVVILNDNDFAWFARFGLAVNARNVLDSEKKTSQNLWYEETIPPDSLFYSLLADRNGGNSLDEVQKLFNTRPYIQVGGNETVGQGWLAVRQLEGGAA